MFAEVGLDDNGVNAQGRTVGVMCGHGIVFEGIARGEGPVDEREQVGSGFVEEAEEEGAGLGLTEVHAFQGGGFILLRGVVGEGRGGEGEGRGGGRAEQCAALSEGIA